MLCTKYKKRRRDFCFVGKKSFSKMVIHHSYTLLVFRSYNNSKKKSPFYTHNRCFIRQPLKTQKRIRVGALTGVRNWNEYHYFALWESFIWVLTHRKKKGRQFFPDSILIGRDKNTIQAVSVCVCANQEMRKVS